MKKTNITIIKGKDEYDKIIAKVLSKTNIQKLKDNVKKYFPWDSEKEQKCHLNLNVALQINGAFYNLLVERGKKNKKIKLNIRNFKRIKRMYEFFS